MIDYEPIGRIRSPYDGAAPFQPVPEPGDFAIEVDGAYADGLNRLDAFEYAYVLFHLDRSEGYSLSITPPWSDRTVGLFATRAPRRPNPIGLSVVRIIGIEDSRVGISAIDAFDGTPVLDLKPYVEGLDSKPDADVGWIDRDHAADIEHLELHLKGIPH